MDYVRMFQYVIRMKWLAALLTVATLSWAVGVPFIFNTATAATLSLVSATASSSNPLTSTNYMVRFTNVNPIGSGIGASTTRITFDPYDNLFDLTSVVLGTDVTISGANVTQRANIGACTGPTTNEMYPSALNANPDYIEFTSCTGDVINAGAITVSITNAHVVNPSPIRSYVVRINGGVAGASAMTDAGDTRVAIINHVTMTAIVDTNLTFTIAGVASSSLVNGDYTSTSTLLDATKIGFGVLSVGTSSIAAQDITVATNAANGFSVTITENQDLTSNNGATINAFRDGNAVVGAPVAWAAPLGTLGNLNSYGHMGVSSEDATLSGGDEFGTSLYAGLTSTSTRTVLYHTSVADGVTPNIGSTRVGYRVQVTALQEAATDYNNIITYVCTPIF